MKKTAKQRLVCCFVAQENITIFSSFVCRQVWHINCNVIYDQVKQKYTRRNWVERWKKWVFWIQNWLSIKFTRENYICKPFFSLFFTVTSFSYHSLSPTPKIQLLLLMSFFSFVTQTESKRMSIAYTQFIGFEQVFFICFSFSVLSLNIISKKKHTNIYIYIL